MMGWSDQEQPMGRYDWVGGLCFSVLLVVALALVAAALTGVIVPVR